MKKLPLARDASREVLLIFLSSRAQVISHFVSDHLIVSIRVFGSFPLQPRSVVGCCAVKAFVM